MTILFEEYEYQTEAIKDCLGGFILSKLNLEKPVQKLKYVGYFYNRKEKGTDKTKEDLVFILPKVLIDENGLAFGIDPKEFLDFNWEDWKKERDEKVCPEGKLSKKNVYDFIYVFTTWIYRAVDIYRANQKRKPKNNSNEFEAEVMTSVQVGKSGKKKNATFMDIILSLLDFQKTHRDFITFVMKMAHAGFNRINWQRTIVKTSAVIQDDSPIYLDPITKKREINYDEELLIIYYSILNDIHKEYGFPISNQPGYKLIAGALFESYKHKKIGKRRLLKIRYKYYSDSAILLWNLCYSYFNQLDNLRAQANRNDYLLVNSFHYVFEAMIDELIGDKNLPTHLKKQADDKRIDHLYTYKYLLERMSQSEEADYFKKIYNIADSKYYGRNEQLNGHDVPKQFTYARNVIQWHMDLLNGVLDKSIQKDAQEYLNIPLFDEVSEGYNIIPNFFISAKLDEGLSYDKDGLNLTEMKDTEKISESFHFWDRLFDRSSLFTIHYDVNFLYVLKRYSQNRLYEKSVWKKKVHHLFREQILTHLNSNFDFYQIQIDSAEIPDFVERNFRHLIGKIFSFMYQGARILIYAERKPNDGTTGGDSTQTSARTYFLKGYTRLKINSRVSQPDPLLTKVRLGESEYQTQFLQNECVILPKQLDEINVLKFELHDESNIDINGDALQIESGVSSQDTEDAEVVDDYLVEQEVIIELKFRTHLPVYHIKAACGYFDEGFVPGEEEEGWLDVSSEMSHLNENMFVVYASGDSMEPKISDGDLCVFERCAGSRNGEIVLTSCLNKDNDYDCSYTIKKYQSEKIVSEEGWNHASIKLIPLNDDYAPIEISEEDAESYRTIGVLRKVLK